MSGLPVVVDNSAASGLSSEPVLDPTLTPAPSPSPSPAGTNPTPAPAPTSAPEAPVSSPATDPAASPEPAPADSQETNRVDPANYQQEGVVVPSHADPRVNSVESLLAEKGITNDQAMRVFGEALQSMDFTKVNVADLEALVGKASTQLIMSNLEAYNADMVRSEQAALDYAHTQFGGKEKFDTAVKWMNDNINHPSLSADLHAIKQMCAQGGAPMRLALETLQNRFNASGQAPMNIINPDGSAGGAPSLEPFSNRREYAEAIQEAFWKGDKAGIDKVNARFAVSKNLHSKS